MKISVIIPTMGRPDDLRRALDSILAQTRPPEEVVLVDQSDDTRTESLVRDFEGKASPIRFIYAHRDIKGTAKARNHGIGLASGDVFCFLDDDIILHPDYFEKIGTFLEKNPSVGGLSGNARVDQPAKGWRWQVRKVLQKFFLISYHDGRMTASGFGYPIVEREIKKITEVEMLPGCNINVRRELAVKLLFDEWFTGYSYREDVDFSYRLSRVAPVMMIQEARLYHAYSPVNRLSVYEYKRMEVKNCRYVARKFKGSGFWAGALFAYSLAGLAFLEFIEFLSGFKEEKWKKFTTNVSASWSVLAHDK